MAKSGLSKGLRKFIRQEKARIRREVLGAEEQKKQIQQLFQKYFKNTNLYIRINS